MRDFVNNKVARYNKAIFLDRDGTINIDTVMPHRKEHFFLFDDSIEAMRLLSKLNAYIFIITNQSGIALGKYSIENMSNFNRILVETLALNGVRVDGIYFCPHYDYKNLPKGHLACECSKPKAGLLYEANEDFDFNLKDSIVIGDKHTDIGAGINAGLKNTILVTTGIYKHGSYKNETLSKTYEPKYITSNLIEAANIVITIS